MTEKDDAAGLLRSKFHRDPFLLSFVIAFILIHWKVVIVLSTGLPYQERIAKAEEMMSLVTALYALGSATFWTFIWPSVRDLFERISISRDMAQDSKLAFMKGAGMVRIDSLDVMIDKFKQLRSLYNEESWLIIKNWEPEAAAGRSVTARNSVREELTAIVVASNLMTVVKHLDTTFDNQSGMPVHYFRSKLGIKTKLTWWRRWLIVPLDWTSNKAKSLSDEIKS